MDRETKISTEYRKAIDTYNKHHDVYVCLRDAFRRGVTTREEFAVSRKIFMKTVDACNAAADAEAIKYPNGYGN